MRRAAIALAALAALALSGPGTAPAQGKTTVSFWAGEVFPGTDWSAPADYWNQRDVRAFRPGVWRALRRHRIPLYFHLRYGRDFGPIPSGRPRRDDALEIVRKANRLGVPIWGWVLVPFTEEYWAGEGGAAAQFAAVKSLVRWARAHQVRFRGLALDLETPVDVTSEINAAIMDGEPASPAFLGTTIAPARQCAALRGYARIARWAKRRGIRLSASPSASALDDVEDGSLALQDAAQFVVPSGPWHSLYFQAYRSVLEYYSGSAPGPGIVSSYLRSARREFGGVGQISLGSSGRGAYRRLGNLVHDVRLAATLGAREVPIFSLERTVRAYGGPSALARLARAANRPFAGERRTREIAPTAPAQELRDVIRRTDAALTAAAPAANAWPSPCEG